MNDNWNKLVLKFVKKYCMWLIDILGEITIMYQDIRTTFVKYI